MSGVLAFSSGSISMLLWRRHVARKYAEITRDMPEIAAGIDLDAAVATPRGEKVRRDIPEIAAERSRQIYTRAQRIAPSDL